MASREDSIPNDHGFHVIGGGCFDESRGEHQNQARRSASHGRNKNSLPPWKACEALAQPRPPTPREYPMDDLRCMTKSQRCKRSEKSGKSRKHQRDLQLRRPQPFNQGKPPLESPPPGGKERRLIGSRWDLHEAAAVTILTNASGVSATSRRCRVSGSRTRRPAKQRSPNIPAIALGGVPIKKIRCTKGELAGNKIPFLLRPMARKNRETAFVLAWGKATPSPEAVDNVDSRKRTCSRKISESKTA